MKLSSNQICFICSVQMFGKLIPFFCLNDISVNYLIVWYFNIPIRHLRYFIFLIIVEFYQYNQRVVCFFSEICCFKSLSGWFDLVHISWVESCGSMFFWTRARPGPDRVQTRSFFSPISGTLCVHEQIKLQGFSSLLTTLKKCHCTIISCSSFSHY
jgi:hypothetical protein